MVQDNPCSEGVSFLFVTPIQCLSLAVKNDAYSESEPESIGVLRGGVYANG